MTMNSKNTKSFQIKYKKISDTLLKLPQQLIKKQDRYAKEANEEY